jgi:hypothetical protein
MPQACVFVLGVYSSLRVHLIKGVIMRATVARRPTVIIEDVAEDFLRIMFGVPHKEDTVHGERPDFSTKEKKPAEKPTKKPVHK